MVNWRKKETYDKPASLLFAVAVILILAVFIKQEYIDSNKGYKSGVSAASKSAAEKKTTGSAAQTYIDPGKGTPIVVPPVDVNKNRKTKTDNPVGTGTKERLPITGTTVN